MSSIIAKILAEQAEKRIKQVFENLKEGEFEITSPFDAKYNCIAHAADDNEKWWWAVDTKTAGNDVFWFNNIPSQATLENFILAFQKLGYQPCDNPELEKDFDVTIITQNIDDLHERAGSTKVLHLHGEIFKMRSEKNEEKYFEIRGNIKMGDFAADGGQLRPHIVWFGEPVYMMERAIPVVQGADIFVVAGTSLVVYPAAGLVNYANWEIPKYIIDKKIPYTTSIKNLTAIAISATSLFSKKRNSNVARQLLL